MFRRLKFLAAFLIIVLIFLPIFSGAVKIVSWNILNFPGSTGASREDDFRKAITQLNPDILVVQEMLSHYGVNQFLNNVMNYSSSGIYEAAPFFDGPDTDNALFYKKSSVNLLSWRQIPTSLRDISEYILLVISGPAKGTIFRIYSLHLKSGSSSADEAERENEAKILRGYLNDLPPNSYFLLCGDYNLESSNEKAFIVFTENEADNDGRVKDPINKPGTWHDNMNFANIHTQSTRASQFGGGASGGLDDRFDLILMSDALEISSELRYKSGSYNAYGNDGNHFNKSINDGANAAVDSENANALYQASDHLPVIIELERESLVIYPPLQFVGQKFRVRSFRLADCMNFLTWQPNPKNLNIVKYKIYQIEGENKSLLAELNANIFYYLHWKVYREKEYTYALVAVNNENREGDPAYITVR
jgi:endonuclease/exonuclease/phosphatase family metal-dependent hydrolase